MVISNYHNELSLFIYSISISTYLLKAHIWSVCASEWRVTKIVGYGFCRYWLVGCGLVGNLKKLVAVTTNSRLFGRLSVITYFWVKMYHFNPLVSCGLLRLSTRLEIVGCGYIKNSRLRVGYAVNHSFTNSHVQCNVMAIKNDFTIVKKYMYTYDL